jgi:hypothetical protein
MDDLLREILRMLPKDSFLCQYMKHLDQIFKTRIANRYALNGYAGPATDDSSQASPKVLIEFMSLKY